MQIEKVRVVGVWMIGIAKLNGAPLLAGRDIPESEESMMLAGDQRTAIGGELDVANVALLLARQRELAHQTLAGHVPQADGAGHPVAARQEPAVRADSNRRGRAEIAGTVLQLLARDHVPHV